jgi:hypothetical protein
VRTVSVLTCCHLVGVSSERASVSVPASTAACPACPSRVAKKLWTPCRVGWTVDGERFPFPPCPLAGARTGLMTNAGSVGLCASSRHVRLQSTTSGARSALAYVGVDSGAPVDSLPHWVVPPQTPSSVRETAPFAPPCALIHDRVVGWRLLPCVAACRYMPGWMDASSHAQRAHPPCWHASGSWGSRGCTATCAARVVASRWLYHAPASNAPAPRCKPGLSRACSWGFSSVRPPSASPATIERLRKAHIAGLLEVILQVLPARVVAQVAHEDPITWGLVHASARRSLRVPHFIHACVAKTNIDPVARRDACLAKGARLAHAEGDPRTSAAATAAATATAAAAAAATARRSTVALRAVTRQVSRLAAGVARAVATPTTITTRDGAVVWVVTIGAETATAAAASSVVATAAVVVHAHTSFFWHPGRAARSLYAPSACRDDVEGSLRQHPRAL